MAKNNGCGSKANLPAKQSVADKGDGGSPPKLQRLDSNPQGNSARNLAGISRTLTHSPTLSLPAPLEEARFTLSTRTYHTPSDPDAQQGTAFTMTRGPAIGRARPPTNCSSAPDRRLGGHRLGRRRGASRRAMFKSSIMRGRSTAWRPTTGI